MEGHKIINLANGILSSDGANISQIGGSGGSTNRIQNSANNTFIQCNDAPTNPRLDITCPSTITFGGGLSIMDMS